MEITDAARPCFVAPGRRDTAGGDPFVDEDAPRLLSRREMEVLTLVCQDGVSSEEVVDRLAMSWRAVHGCICGICAKLGVDNRAEALAEANRRGLFTGRWGPEARRWRQQREP